MSQTVKFTTYFDFAKKSKRKAGEGLDVGTYPFYVSSQSKIKKCNTPDYEGDALVFGTGGNASVHFASGKFSTSTDCIVAFTKADKNLAKAIHYYLKSNMHILEQGFKGAGLKHISKSYISELNLPDLSNLNTPHILNLLDKADELVKLRQQAIDKLETLSQSIFYDMFGDPLKAEVNTDKNKLSKFAELINGDRSNKYPKNDELVPNGILFLNTKNINKNTLDLETASFITKEKFDSLSRGKLQPNDLVITLRGTLGQCALFNCKYETGFINAQLMIIRCKPTLKPSYIKGIFTSGHMQKKLKTDSSGAAVPQLTSKQIGEIEINIPDFKKQELYEGKINAVERLISNYKKALDEELKMFKSLQQRAFRGEL